MHKVISEHIEKGAQDFTIVLRFDSLRESQIFKDFLYKKFKQYPLFASGTLVHTTPETYKAVYGQYPVVPA